jgi:hypothetical protein
MVGGEDLGPLVSGDREQECICQAYSKVPESEEQPASLKGVMVIKGNDSAGAKALEPENAFLGGSLSFFPDELIEGFRDERFGQDELLGSGGGLFPLSFPFFRNGGPGLNMHHGIEKI